MRNVVTALIFLVATLVVPSASAQTAGWTQTGTTTTTTNNVGVGATPVAAVRLHTSGDVALRVETINSQGWYVDFQDSLTKLGIPNGIVTEFGGNSEILISNLQLGHMFSPELNSRNGLGLYLNWRTDRDVHVGNPTYTAAGLRVLSSGNSSFAGRVGLGLTAPSGPLHIRSTGFFGGADVLNEKSTNDAVGYALKRDEAGGMFNETWNIYMPASQRQLLFYGGGANRVAIMNNGNVGIGEVNPTSLLQVAGTARVTQTLTVDQSISTPTVNAASVLATNVTATGVISGGRVIATYEDVAEWVPATQEMDAGTVVVLNRSRINEVMPSIHAYDTAVAGVVSAQPGVILGIPSASKAQIATTGRVKMRVDASVRPIAIGDLLVTSDTQGRAMKSEPIDVGGISIHRPGTVIGKALEPLERGTGEILVLLSLQ